MNIELVKSSKELRDLSVKSIGAANVTAEIYDEIGISISEEEEGSLRTSTISSTQHIAVRLRNSSDPKIKQDKVMIKFDSAEPDDPSILIKIIGRTFAYLDNSAKTHFKKIILPQGEKVLGKIYKKRQEKPLISAPNNEVKASLFDELRKAGA